VFIDSNIPMYVAGGVHANREPARRILDQVRRGKLDACTSTEVLQEILYRYSSLQRLDLAREIYDLFVEICPVVLSVTLADTDRARDVLCSAPGISARDSIHAGVMLNHDVEWIATFDAGFDRVTGIKRLKMPDVH
jgi:predicted nucleic acid-binding protein